MDKTLQALKDRFRRLEWRAESSHYTGQRGQIVVTVWHDGGDAWGDGGRGDSWRATGSGGSTWTAVRGASAVEAVEKLAAEVQLSAALSGLPAEPEEWRAPERDPMAGVALLLGGGCCLLMPVELLLMGIAAIFRSRWGAFVLFVVVAVGFVAYFGGLL